MINSYSQQLVWVTGSVDNKTVCLKLKCWMCADYKFSICKMLVLNYWTLGNYSFIVCEMVYLFVATSDWKYVKGKGQKLTQCARHLCDCEYGDLLSYPASPTVHHSDCMIWKASSFHKELDLPTLGSYWIFRLRSKGLSCIFRLKILKSFSNFCHQFVSMKGINPENFRPIPFYFNFYFNFLQNR